MASEIVPKKPEMSPKMALDLITPYFVKEWRQTDPKDVTIEAIKGGYCNSIYKVSRRSASEQVSKSCDPESLIIRIRGGNLINVDQFDCLNTYNAIMLVSFEMSRRKLGPKLYGMFTSTTFGVGSIEEYVEGHTLTPEEAADPIISASFARQLAKVHSIKGLPLKNNSLDENLAQVEKFAKKVIEIREKFLSHPKIVGASAEERKLLENFDLMKEKYWLDEVINESIKDSKVRINFGLMDLNYLNCIIRENEDSESESKIVFVDYDAAQYNLRGLDFSSHFFGRVLDGRISGKIIPGSKFPTKEEKIEFLKNYQQKIKNLNCFPDFDEYGLDSIPNMLRETLIGTLQHINFFMGMVFTQHEIFLKDEDNFYPLIIFNLKTFYQFKDELINFYG